MERAGDRCKSEDIRLVSHWLSLEDEQLVNTFEDEDEVAHDNELEKSEQRSVKPILT